MYKLILVPATGAASDAAVFATAIMVARAAGAHLQFLHVMLDCTAMLTAMASGGLGGGAVVQDMINQAEAEASATEATVRAAFAALCQAEAIPIASGASGNDASGLSAGLAVEIGDTATWLSEYGRFADLIVLGRGRDPAAPEMDMLEAALLDTGRPLLVTAAAPPAGPPQTVVIAWKDALPAARAVAAAMPFIEQASRVVILSVGEGAESHDTSGDRLANWLHWHNPRTERRHLAATEQPAVEQLLAEAATLQAGLLVMGGYGHSRLRETVFGGFTQHALRAAPLPLLLAH